MAGLKDIARECGVSTTTVSRVLNGDMTLSVTAKVREAIHSEADRLGYRTPRQRKARDLSIALALSPIDKPGFEEALINYLHKLVPRTHLSLFSQEESYDGILALGELSNDETSFYASRTRALLLINNKGAGYDYDSISIDYEAAVKSALDHFLSHGITDIGCIGGLFSRAGHLIGSNRLGTFSRLLKEKGLYKEEWFFTGDMSAGYGYECVMGMDEVPSGLFLSDPATAEGARKALSERKLHTETVTYTNFNAQETTEGTALTIFTADMWKTALRLLTEKIRGEREQSMKLYFPGALLYKEK